MGSSPSCAAHYRVDSVERRERRRNAPPPFITSKLQQEAANRLYFTAKKTMTLAQRLYEGVELGDEGQTALITYMRTDSVRLSDDAVSAARSFIAETYGKEALPDEPVVFKSRKSAQDAHEAIRPVSMEWTPDRVRPFLEPDVARLYELIWNRFVACQMKPAVYDQTTVEVAAGRATFRAAGSILKFAGYLAVYGMVPTSEEEAEREKAANDDKADADAGDVQLPELVEGDRLKLVGLGLQAEQHFTQPPPRFTEASLVKELEEQGIGRPSTYASILSVIQDKKYVEKLEGRFHPTELGTITTEELVKHFPHEMDVAFTAGMEEQLDQISEGETGLRVLREFHDPFQVTLAKAEQDMRDVKREEIPTDVNCEKCGKMMAIKWGRWVASRPALATGVQEHQGLQGSRRKVIPVEEQTTDETCEKCGRPMVIKRGRFGRFMACSGYPECKAQAPCPSAWPAHLQGGLPHRATEPAGKFFGCHRYPGLHLRRVGPPCPRPVPSAPRRTPLQKYSKRDGARVVCPNKECGPPADGGRGRTGRAPSSAA
jgi:DNA topoisomerase-1